MPLPVRLKQLRNEANSSCCDDTFQRGRRRARTHTHTPRTYARACCLAHDDAFAARVPSMHSDCRRQEIVGAAAAVVVEEDEVTVEEGESLGAKVGLLKRKKIK